MSEQLTDKLTKLLSRCKCGVYLEVNTHRDVYKTATEALEELEEMGYAVEPEVRAKIIETDTLIDLHFYPETPIGFFKVLHHDLGAILDEAMEILEELPNYDLLEAALEVINLVVVNNPKKD